MPTSPLFREYEEVADKHTYLKVTIPVLILSALVISLGFMTPFTHAIAQCFWELQTIMLYPVISYILPLMSYFELLSPVLDAFEVDAQVTLILFSLAASLALLNEMVQALSYTLFSSSRSGDSSAGSTSNKALESTLSHLRTPNKVASSRYPTFRRLLTMTSLFK